MLVSSTFVTNYTNFGLKLQSLLSYSTINRSEMQLGSCYTTIKVPTERLSFLEVLWGNYFLSFSHFWRPHVFLDYVFPLPSSVPAPQHLSDPAPIVLSLYRAEKGSQILRVHVSRLGPGKSLYLSVHSHSCKVLFKKLTTKLILI